MTEHSSAGRKSSPRAFTLAVSVFQTWQSETNALPLDRVLESRLREARELNSGERRWIGDAVFAAVRFLRRDAALLTAHGLPDTPENRIALYALEPLTLCTPDQVPLLETTAAVLPPLGTPAEYLRETLSFPDDLASTLEELLGDEAISAAEAFNQQAATVLRVNTLKARRHPILYAFPGSKPTRFSPWGVELAQRVNLPALPGFKAGEYEIQDEASQLAVLLTAAKPNQTVVEIGAGGGGKTLALAALMENRGRIVAIDTVSARMDEIGRRLTRAGVQGVEMMAVPADQKGMWQPTANLVRRMERLDAIADAVLLDAPCTGSGVLRRNPDAKWRTANQAPLLAVQQNLLRQSAPFVKVGGVLIYVTCALERCQNEEQVAAFFASEAGQNFEAVEALPRLQSTLRRFGNADVQRDAEAQSLVSSGVFLRTYPHRHRMDGFFMACLRRVA
jgi:16S rRNA (cytosine967-C5)-methyltransferase